MFCNIVMDPLLSTMESAGIGVSVNGLFGGAYLHADDIRSIATSSEGVKAQVEVVLNFTKANFLKLNPTKCEVVSFSANTNVTPPVITIDGKPFPKSTSAKCLGYHWSHDLSALTSIEGNIIKARRSFFNYGGMGVFQGYLSPLSGREVVVTCIFPVLFYGCENWCLTNRWLQLLDSFLGELCKRLLRLPTWYSNTPAMVICGLQSARCICTCRKLSFLCKVVSEDRNCPISHDTFKALTDDVESICLVRECKELESYFGTGYTSSIMVDATTCPSHREIKKTIKSRDTALRLRKCGTGKVMKTVCEIEECIGWPLLWDMALDNGQKCIDGIKNLVRIITYPDHATKPCPLCDVTSLLGFTLLDHVLEQHSSTASVKSEQLLTSLLAVTDSDSSFFQAVCVLENLF